MIVFLEEERSYHSWISHHRDGFVLDWLRKPTRKTPVVHRASCPQVRTSKTKNTHWTTGRHLKACSLEIEKLIQWANSESGHPPEFCESCKPHDPVLVNELAGSDVGHDHLTKLGREILDYVLDVAVVSLDSNEAYELCVGDIAQCLAKSPAQITDALLRLVGDDYLKMEGELNPGSALQSARMVFPTTRAMQTLPAFEQQAGEDIEEELNQLR